MFIMQFNWTKFYFDHCGQILYTTELVFVSRNVVDSTIQNVDLANDRASIFRS